MYFSYFLFSFHGSPWDGEGLAADMSLCTQNLWEGGIIVGARLSEVVLRMLLIGSAHNIVKGCHKYSL